MNKTEKDLNKQPVLELLEKHAEGIPLRDIKTAFPKMHYYQIYKILSELGYTFDTREMLIPTQVRYVIKQGDK